MYARLALLTAFVLPVAACDDHGHDGGYASLQVCFDEHTGAEGLTPTQSITICTLEHPLGGQTLDFATAAECVTYVTANLAAGGATTAEIMAGCDEYIRQKGM